MLYYHIPSDFGAVYPCSSLCDPHLTYFAHYCCLCPYLGEGRRFGSDQTVYSRPATNQVLKIQDYCVKS